MQLGFFEIFFETQISSLCQGLQIVRKYEKLPSLRKSSQQVFDSF